MKKLIMIAVLLQATMVHAQTASAASVRINFTHSNKDTAGLPVTLTSFRAYFDLDTVAIPAQVFDISPIPTAVSVDANGISSYSVLMTSAALVRGNRYCFQMTARMTTSVETLESDRTIPLQCVRIPNRPAAVGQVTFP